MGAPVRDKMTRVLLTLVYNVATPALLTVAGVIRSNRGV